MFTSLKGKLLISMPGMTDTTFHESLVFLCAHGTEGAMGLIINKPMAGLNFLELADRLDMRKTTQDVMQQLEQTEILMGGPVEQQRGFVLHSGEYDGGEGSVRVNRDFALTATVDILQDMARGKGPKRTLLALGYAGWAPGQLENEMKHNGWLHCEASPKLVFAADAGAKYRQALQHMGVDPAMLSSTAGHD